MVMVFPHIAIVVDATLNGFYMAGSAALMTLQESLFDPIETIWHGEDRHVLQSG